jgi:hypothetical protein
MSMREPWLTKSRHDRLPLIAAMVHHVPRTCCLIPCVRWLPSPPSDCAPGAQAKVTLGNGTSVCVAEARKDIVKKLEEK